MSRPRVAVVGQVARDLVLRVHELPGSRASAKVWERREMLGGKGANQAVGMVQLGADASLVGVLGDDQVSDQLLVQARDDGVDVGNVVRRPGAESGLIVDLLVDGEGWRYFEHLAPEVLLRPEDIEAASGAIAAAGTVVLQMQQPPPSLLLAARVAKEAGRQVVLDGNPSDEALLGMCDVARLDSTEASLLAGHEVHDGPSALNAARSLVRRGPRLVAVEAGGDGNVLVWDGGESLVPLTKTEVVDTTGGGDAFVAALVVALARGEPPAEAGRAATEAAGLVVRRPGGRPSLPPRPDLTY
ncbi:MAG: PfkB family carbohydrate kinase [Acidimicrobiales bacterium]